MQRGSLHPHSRYSPQTPSCYSNDTNDCIPPQVLFRKGGIKEPTFRPEAGTFLLFPTAFHTEQQLLKPGVAERYQQVRHGVGGMGLHVLAFDVLVPNSSHTGSSGVPSLPSGRCAAHTSLQLCSLSSAQMMSVQG